MLKALSAWLTKASDHEATGDVVLSARLAPDSARYVYVYAVALNSAGRVEEAIAVMSDAARRFPADFDISWAMVTLLRDAGRLDEARDAAADLVRRFPGNENASNLLNSFDAA